MNPTGAITEHVVAGLVPRGGDVPPVPVAVTLTWRPGDPWTVELGFRVGPDPADTVVWVLGRDLLREGLDTDVGAGDVRVRPLGRGDAVTVGLCSPSGRATVRFDTEALGGFLHATYARVPAGEELGWVAVDAEIAHLLDGGGPGWGRGVAV